ncbi:hypothetical protein NECAME_04653, partial [Necator americanus]
YPLLIEKILKECDPNGELYQDLDTALQLLRALVSEVNRAVTEEENIFLLCWAQSHVKCPPSLKKISMDKRIIGRLLVEIMNIQNINPKTLNTIPQVIRLSLGKSHEMFDVDLSKNRNDLHLTSQFPFEHTSLNFTVTLLHKNIYRPDVPLLEGNVDLVDLLRESSNHRGPLIKRIFLRKDIIDKTKPVETIVVKFVVQMFDDNM